MAVGERRGEESDRLIVVIAKLPKKKNNNEKKKRKRDFLVEQITCSLAVVYSRRYLFGSKTPPGASLAEFFVQNLNFRWEMHSIFGNISVRPATFPP